MTIRFLKIFKLALFETEQLLNAIVTGGDLE
jgi:hypothetical protein